MARRTLAALGAAVALVGLGGCGTVTNLTVAEICQDPPRSPYGGVRCDAESIPDYFAGPFAQEHVEPLIIPGAWLAGIYVLFVDTPLSVLGDTLTLPYTVYVTASEKQARQAPESKVAPLAVPSPPTPP
jgi:uncharacterized protein YceK